MEPRSEHRAESEAGGNAALGRALSILEYLAEAQAPRGLTEIAEHVGGPKATVHRLMSTLTARGYIRQNTQSAYELGIRCFELGSKWEQGLDLRSVASPHLAKLNEETQETVVLAVYESGSVVYIDKLTSPQPVIATTLLGRRSPASLVAAGLALLAYQPVEEINSYLASYTGPEADELERTLRDVRQEGHAITRETYRAGVSGLACPVRDYTGMVVASVGLTVPTDRFSTSHQAELLDASRRCAHAITSELGGHALVG